MTMAAMLEDKGLLEGDEPGGVGSSDTGTAVLHRLVGDAELAQVVSNHVRLDLHLVEDLSVVDTDHTSHHLRDDDDIPEVSLDYLRLLQGWAFLLSLAQLLEKGHGLALQSTFETSPCTAVEQLSQLIIAHV